MFSVGDKLSQRRQTVTIFVGGVHVTNERHATFWARELQITEHPVPDRKETKLTFAFELLWEQQTTYNTRNIYS